MNGKGILTFNGAFVTCEEGSDVPAPGDLLRSLSRMPRFAGHTRVPWTVLQHSLVVASLAEQEPAGRSAGLALAALLHDAHECITGDIPTPFKSAANKGVQYTLDQQLMDKVFPGGYNQFREYEGEVAALDRRALLAEALVVGPPCIKTDEDVFSYFGGVPDQVAIDTVEVIAKAAAMCRIADTRSRHLSGDGSIGEEPDAAVIHLGALFSEKLEQYRLQLFLQTESARIDIGG